jgi:hypothetical protein
MTKKLSPYLQRLRAVSELYTSSGNKNTTKSLAPKVVFLDIEQGVTRAGDAIAEGWPVVTDYGATFGTAFPPHIREQIAVARRETSPLATVSLVTMKAEALEWMDMDTVHPTIAQLVVQGELGILEGISFIRFPASQKALASVDSACINQANEIQVFIVPEDDPLMRYLKKKHSIHSIAVRSSNITGKLEETSVRGAMQYATEIGAPLFVMRSLHSFYSQVEDEEHKNKKGFQELHRKRIGSQPIIRLPHKDEPAEITLVRAGNTHPDTMERLLKAFTDAGVPVVHRPEKKAPKGRAIYEVDASISDPVLIRRLLLQASNLL